MTDGRQEYKGRIVVRARELQDGGGWRERHDGAGVSVSQFFLPRNSVLQVGRWPSKPRSRLHEPRLTRVSQRNAS
jgi:hypothetical protein